MRSKKYGTQIFSGQTLCRKKKSYKKSTGSKKRKSYFWVLFCQINPFFQHFFIWTDFRFKQKKQVPAKKAPKSMSSFSWNPSFFWGSYFGQDNVWHEKLLKFIFSELELSLGTHTFLAQCLARQGMSSFCLVFFGGGGHSFLGHNVWPEKVWVPLFWNSYFFLDPILAFWHNAWPEKVWVPFFLNSYFLLEPILFLAQCWAR